MTEEIKPKCRTLQELLENDPQAAELYAVLPAPAQAMVGGNIGRIRDIGDMERVVNGYLEE